MVRQAAGQRVLHVTLLLGALVVLGLVFGEQAHAAEDGRPTADAAPSTAVTRADHSVRTGTVRTHTDIRYAGTVETPGHAAAPAPVPDTTARQGAPGQDTPNVHSAPSDSRAHAPRSPSSAQPAPTETVPATHPGDGADSTSVSATDATGATGGAAATDAKGTEAATGGAPGADEVQDTVRAVVRALPQELLRSLRELAGWPGAPLPGGPQGPVGGGEQQGPSLPGSGTDGPADHGREYGAGYGSSVAGADATGAGALLRGERTGEGSGSGLPGGGRLPVPGEAPAAVLGATSVTGSGASQRHAEQSAALDRAGVTHRLMPGAHAVVAGASIRDRHRDIVEFPG